MSTRPRRVWHGPPELRKWVIPIASVKPLDENRRRGDVDLIRESLREHGQYKAIIARRETGEVLVGNHTTQAVREEGWTHIAVQWRTEPDDDEAKRLAIVDNRTSDLAEWDVAGLAADLVELNDRGGLAGTGYTEASLQETLRTAARLAASEAARALGDLAEPSTPTPPQKPRTRLGDVITLGDHMLMCMDCREPPVLAFATDRHPPNLVLADPPYGVNERTDRATKGRGGYTPDGQQLAGQGIARSNDFPAVIGDDQPFDPSHLLAHKRLILFGANHYANLLPPSPSWIVWDKLDGLQSSRPVGFNDNGDCELAWTNLGGPIRAFAHRWTGLLKGSERGQARVHATQKPVALMAMILQWRTVPGDLVLDPYAGSGPVLLACEEIGRRCISIEIDPAYCDVIVERWETQTGQQADRPARRRRRAQPKEKS